jgi:hypothetical protein
MKGFLIQIRGLLENIIRLRTMIFSTIYEKKDPKTGDFSKNPD